LSLCHRVSIVSSSGHCRVTVIIVRSVSSSSGWWCHHQVGIIVISSESLGHLVGVVVGLLSLGWHHHWVIVIIRLVLSSGHHPRWVIIIIRSSFSHCPHQIIVIIRSSSSSGCHCHLRSLSSSWVVVVLISAIIVIIPPIGGEDKFIPLNSDTPMGGGSFEGVPQWGIPPHRDYLHLLGGGAPTGGDKVPMGAPL
jgi:hypothetical protein